MAQTSMETTIQQWVSIQREKEKEQGARAIAKTILDRAMKELQTIMDTNGETPNKIPDEIIFEFKDNGEFWVGGLQDDMSDIQIPNEATREKVCKQIKKAFEAIPTLKVREKKDCYDGLYYTVLYIRVKLEDEET